MTGDAKLPPLPYPQIPGNDYDPSDMWNYARAAIKFDRQQRGELVGYVEPVVIEWLTDPERTAAAQMGTIIQKTESSEATAPLYTTPQHPPTPAQEPGFEVRERGFLYENGKHTPTLLLAFPIGDWDSRDRLAAMLEAAPKFGEEE